MCSTPINQPAESELKQLLRENVLKVVFIKSTGEQRVMRCTTREDKIPPQEPKNTTRQSGSAITAWDLDIAQWRSFRHDRLVSVDIINE